MKSKERIKHEIECLREQWKNPHTNGYVKDVCLNKVSALKWVLEEE